MDGEAHIFDADVQSGDAEKIATMLRAVGWRAHVQRLDQCAVIESSSGGQRFAILVASAGADVSYIFTAYYTEYARSAVVVNAYNAVANTATAYLSDENRPTLRRIVLGKHITVQGFLLEFVFWVREIESFGKWLQANGD